MKQTGLVIVAVFVGGCSLVPRGVAVTSASLVQGDEQRIELRTDGAPASCARTGTLVGSLSHGRRRRVEMAPRSVAATAVAIFAAVATSAGDLGATVWELLIAGGSLAEPICPDTTAVPLGAGICARPTTLIVTSAVTALLAGALAGLVAFALLARTKFQPPTGADVTGS